MEKQPGASPDTGRYFSREGLNLYYEVHGSGAPLVLLHGGFGVVGMFGRLLPQLASTRQVIAVELQAHGHTADIARPLSFESMADDIAALLAHLGHASADILGYSMGGGVALQTAIRHASRVHKLVMISAPCKSSGWHAESRAGMGAINAALAMTWIGSPMHQAYVSVAPMPENWPLLATKTGLLLGQDYDWSAQFAGLGAPTLIVVGDGDSVRPAHAIEMFALLGGGQKDAGWDGSGMASSRLAILPATTHYNVLESPLLAGMIAAFLA